MSDKAKVLLFETCIEDQNVGRGERNDLNNVAFPIGITYLDSSLKKNGYSVLTKDYTLWHENHCLEDIRKQIETFKPDFVGISVMSMTRVSAYKAIKLIKSINKDIKIILGGIHPSVMYAQLLENLPIYAVFIGEADFSLIELLEATLKNKPLNKIKGIAYMSKGKVIVTEKRELNQNIDNLPFPNYDAFMNPSIKKVQMITSRGCPNKCSFCCLDVISRRVWRPRNPKKVVDEIEYIIKKYPRVEEIEFIDDTLTLDNQRVIEICKEILKRGIKMKFFCQGRIKPVSREMFYWMEKAGFVQIGFGIETGSKKLLESIHKNITQEDCINTMTILKEFKKLRAAKYLMVGFPGETNETVAETIEFIKKLQKIKRMGYFYASPLWVYPGTEVYEIAKARGAIDDSYWMTNKPCPLFTLEHSEKELIKMSNKIGIETMLDLGYGFFFIELIKRMWRSPKYYMGRIFGITNLTGFR